MLEAPQAWTKSARSHQNTARVTTLHGSSCFGNTTISPMYLARCAFSMIFFSGCLLLGSGSHRFHIEAFRRGNIRELRVDAEIHAGAI